MTGQYALHLPHKEAMAADDFMVTASNREAFTWIDKWPDWPAPTLALYGPSGSGKTHLMEVFLTKSRGKIVMPADLVAENAINLIADNHVIAIDNASSLVGHSAYEETFFHLYNGLQEAKGFLLLTAPHAPAQWGLQLPDLRSRLSAAPAIAIQAPDDALMSALLIKQFRDRQIDIGRDVVDYILARIERTPEALRTLVTALDHTSLAEKRGITIALARQLLEDQSFLIS